MDQHVAQPSRLARGWQPGTTEAAPAARSVALHAFLADLGEVLKAVPAAWVRCELHKISEKPKVTELELVETDAHGGIVAKVRAVVWPGVWRRISQAFAAAGLSLGGGSRALVHVSARLQPAFGFTLQADDIDLSFSLGDLEARVRAIRQALKAEGLYDRQRGMPSMPDFRRVCVVAPPGAAGRADFVRLAGPLHGHGLVEFTHLDATFQSASASASIRAALRSVYRDCQAGRFCAVALIRGGGASADLAHLVCFDLCRAVCLMPVPVLVGIGHDTDRGLLDEVAHLSLPTPTAVAGHIRQAVVSRAMAAHAALDAIRSGAAAALAQTENLVAQAERKARERSRAAIDGAADGLRDLRRSLEPDARRSLDGAAVSIADKLRDAYRGADSCREHAEAQVRGVRTGIAKLVRERLQRLEGRMAVVRHEIETAPGTRLKDAEADLDGITRSAMDGALARLAEAQALATTQRDAVLAGARQGLLAVEQEVSSARDTASAVDPCRLLTAGYSILRDVEGRPLTTAGALRAEPEIRAELSDGTTALRPVAAE